MSIYNKLYDWQRDIVDFAAAKPAFGLFLDMGLGKTVQGLALAEKVNAEKILIVTKKSKVLETADTPGSWQHWAQSLDGFFLINNKKPEFIESRKEVFVTNYEAVYQRSSDVRGVALKQLYTDFAKSCRHKSVCLILDESHCIKDSSTTQAKALFQLKRELQFYSSSFHTYLLTGTPFTTGFIDIYNQLKFMGCPMTKQEFKDRFCKLGNIRGLLGWQQPIVGYKNLPELYDLIHQYAITIKSADVIKLPPQIFTTEFCPESIHFTSLTRERLTEEILDSLNRERAKDGLPILPASYEPYHVSKSSVLNPWCRNVSYPDSLWVCDTPALLWLRARQLSIGFQGNESGYMWFDRTRLNRIKSYLESNPGNYVLFYNYTPEFYELFDICERLGYNVDCYNGEVKSLHFYEKFSKQSPEEQAVNQKNIILSNFASGSVGMNWQLYNKCIIASLPLYKDWAQGLKRVHRVGSGDPVYYTVFLGDNWLDKEMWKALQSGTDYSQQMFDTAWNAVQLS